MKTKSFDKIQIGFLLGLLGPVIGFCIYGLFWSMRFNKTFDYFLNDLFLAVPAFRSSILSLALLFNLIPFLFFIRTDRYKSARGVLLAVFAFVPFVVYFYFQ